MLCRADFEELFPDLFKPELEPVAAVRQIAKSPSAECIARWEDDGGLHTPPAPQDRTAPARRLAFGYDMERMVTAGAMAATAPVVATYAAASVVLSAYDHMTERRQVML